MNPNEINKAIDILDKFDFFNQRAGRELWSDKPNGIQDKDIKNFSNDVKFLKDFINRQNAEIESLNECYTNLSNGFLQHTIDVEKDRQLLGAYQNMFIFLGFSLEDVRDVELKEIKAWKDRAIWHCKKCNDLFDELKTAKVEAVVEFWNKLKAQNTLDERIVSVASGDNLVKEMVGIQNESENSSKQ